LEGYESFSMKLLTLKINSLRKKKPQGLKTLKGRILIIFAMENFSNKKERLKRASSMVGLGV